uniref:Uncharacterized protein n=1 Tax=Leersia perrieri TaxID=77586 RepID=A0A0D9WWV7_9ORYZ
MPRAWWSVMTAIYIYQIWRKISIGTTTLTVESECHVERNQIFVLKYYPRRRPCWVAVKDLSVYSFFIGKNNAVALYVEGDGGTLWLKSNCVYWIDDSIEQAQVFDTKTGKSQCFPSAKDYLGSYAYAICWCNLGDTRSNTGGSMATSSYQLAKRARYV